jgi:hypothetical protein
MKKFIQFTAVALMVIGILIMLGGLAAGLAAALGGGMHRAFPAPDGDFPYGPHRGMMGGVGLLFMAALLVQGLVVTAVGQGLYLLNNLVLPAAPLQKPAPPAAPRKVAKK